MPKSSTGSDTTGAARRIVIYDTTLRDGAQGPAVSFSASDKVRIARTLDGLGFDYVEGGFPGSNPKDEELFAELAKHPLKRARLAAFGATRRAGGTCADDLRLEQPRPRPAGPRGPRLATPSRLRCGLDRAESRPRRVIPLWLTAADQ